MLSAHFSSEESAYDHSHRTIFSQHWPSFFFFILLIGSSHGIAAADSHRAMENSATSPTHFNFFRSTLRGRQRVLTCAKDPSLCLDREKNPWGGSTSCFRKFCKDTRSDTKRCGECGKTCAFGLICCDGNCVDIQSDPQHCGACFEICPGDIRCAYAMCDYGG